MKEEEIKYNEIEDLDYCLELLEKRDKEIEILIAESTEWEYKCYKYQDIIKEVREYIKGQCYSEELKSCNSDLWCRDCNKVLEILDKEGNSNE